MDPKIQAIIDQIQADVDGIIGYIANEQQAITDAQATIVASTKGVEIGNIRLTQAQTILAPLTYWLFVLTILLKE